MPGAIVVLRNLLDAALGHCAVGLSLRDDRALLIVRELVLLFDQKPIWFSGLRIPAMHPNKSPTALEFGPIQIKFQMSFRQSPVYITVRGPNCRNPTPLRRPRHIVLWELFLRSCHTQSDGLRLEQQGACRQDIGSVPW